MNEDQALARMKTPAHRRNVWRGGVLQIHITRACNESCFGCTQASNVAGKSVMMTPGQFDAACASLKGYTGVIGVFGGNPAMHPQFEELCKIMQEHFPKEQCGLWCNNLMGKGRAARATFNPRVSNLNVHLDTAAHEEFMRDWPETAGLPNLKGAVVDARHSPPFVAMQDVIENESERWDLIANCDVNQYWSALIGVIRGELRAYMCELMYTLCILHEKDQNEFWQRDYGLQVTDGWWQAGIEAYRTQVKSLCHTCGMPLRGHGELAINGAVEKVSKTHVGVFNPKRKDRPVELVELRAHLHERQDLPATNYMEKGCGQ